MKERYVKRKRRVKAMENKNPRKNVDNERLQMVQIICIVNFF